MQNVIRGVYSMKFGYARVSTKEQNLDRQIDWLREQGVEDRNIHVEKISGVKANRPEFNRLMEKLREGDTVLVESFSRLGRSTKDLIDIVERLDRMGVLLISSKENFDTSTAQGKMMLTIVQAFAQFERDLIIERTKEGLAAARARGKKGGRKPLPKDKVAKALKLYDTNTMSLKEIQEMTGVSASTIHRRIRQRKSNNAAYIKKIDESMEQLKQGKVVIKTMEELEEMT